MPNQNASFRFCCDRRVGGPTFHALQQGRRTDRITAMPRSDPPKPGGVTLLAIREPPNSQWALIRQLDRGHASVTQRGPDVECSQMGGGHVVASSASFNGQSCILERIQDFAC